MLFSKCIDESGANDSPLNEFEPTPTVENGSLSGWLNATGFVRSPLRKNSTHIFACIGEPEVLLTITVAVLARLCQSERKAEGEFNCGGSTVTPGIGCANKRPTVTTSNRQKLSWNRRFIVLYIQRKSGKYPVLIRRFFRGVCESNRSFLTARRALDRRSNPLRFETLLVILNGAKRSE